MTYSDAESAVIISPAIIKVDAAVGETIWVLEPMTRADANGPERWESLTQLLLKRQR